MMLHIKSKDNFADIDFISKEAILMRAKRGQGKISQTYIHNQNKLWCNKGKYSFGWDMCTIYSFVFKDFEEFSAISYFSIWGNVWAFHPIGFGGIFCHSVIWLFWLLGLPNCNYCGNELNNRWDQIWKQSSQNISLITRQTLHEKRIFFILEK